MAFSLHRHRSDQASGFPTKMCVQFEFRGTGAERLPAFSTSEIRESTREIALNARKDPKSAPTEAPHNPVRNSCIMDEKWSQTKNPNLHTLALIMRKRIPQSGELSEK